MTLPQLGGEIYVAEEGWTEIIEDIRQRSAGGGIEISRGLRDEGSWADPGTCSFVLNNRHGKYSPRNPNSDYFGRIGRNTPFRLHEHLASDSFDRPNQSTLGTSSDGWQWSGSSAWSIVSGEAVATFSATNQVRRETLLNSESLDSDVLVKIRQPTTITGAALVTGIHARYVNTDNYYWYQLVFETNGKLTLRIAVEVNNTYSVIAELTDIPGAAEYTGDEPWWCLRASTSGVNLAVKVWAHDALEPLDWQLRATDDTHLVAGRTGLGSWLVSGNTNSPLPEVFHDDFVIRVPIFHGEISSWPTRWDLSGNDRWTPVTASGVLRRLGQGQKPVSSPIFRNLSRYEPTSYWPMEDGPDSAVPASGVGGQPPGYSSEVSFGSDDSLPGATTTARLDSATSLIRLINRPATGNTIWSFITFFKLDSAPSTETTLLEITSTGTVQTWRFSIDSVNYRWRALDADGSEVFNEGGNYALAPPTGWMALHLELTQNGSNAEFRTHWHSVGDSTFYNPAGLPVVYAGTIGNPTKVVFGPTALAPASIGHTAFYSSDIPVEISSEFRAISNGYVGETAGNRILRLAAEQGISVVVAGDPDETVAMGRQKARSFLELIKECASVDGGLLYEDRAGLALTYRTRKSLYNREALEVSYTDGQVAEPFEPIEDDAYIRNDVTVTREGGSSARFALESGAMSVQAPPDGVGPYEDSVTLNLSNDDQAQSQASWRVHLGTVDEARYPTVTMNLAAPGLASDPVLARTITALDTGDLLAIADMPSWLPPGPTPLLIRGYSQRLDSYERSITFNAEPGSPWHVFEVGHPVYGRLDTAGSELAMAVDETGTSLLVATDPGKQRWTTSAERPSDFPFAIQMGGEVIKVEAISNTVSPQTFTVTRSVNGIEKAHTPGTRIQLAPVEV